MKKIHILILAVLFIGLASCSKDYLETNPTDSVSEEVVLGDITAMEANLNGIVRYLRYSGSSHDNFGIKACHLAWDLKGNDIGVDEMHWFNWDYQNDNWQAPYRRTTSTWEMFYKVIYNANVIIKNCNTFTTSPQVNGYIAEAKSLRAWAYFNLIQVYQKTYKGHEADKGVPIYTETETKASRNTVAEVYTQITTDLDAAIALWKAGALESSQLSRIKLAVAQGIRAEVSLVMNDWANAKSFAASARSGYSLSTAAQYQMGFDNSTEMVWMWGLENNDEQATTYDSFFSHLDNTIDGYAGLGYSSKFITSNLLAYMENNDVRFTLLTESPSANFGSFYHGKFHAGAYPKLNQGKGKEFSADLVMMRPEEMLLIEAEADYYLGNEDHAKALLKELRDLRYDAASTLSANTGVALRDEILIERRIELWGEGFSLFDIKRNKQAGARNGAWDHYSSYLGYSDPVSEGPEWDYDIPQREIDNNSLITSSDQN